MEKKKILFVCLGNICRSPAAEAIFLTLTKKKNIDVEVDSAGTSAWHSGERADARMRKHAAERGYQITGISRGFDAASDFDRFDMIIAMDDNNYYDLKEMARTTEDESKIYRMGDYLVNTGFDHVPDPYYGGADGFDLVIDLLEKGSRALIKQLNQ